MKKLIFMFAVLFSTMLISCTEHSKTGTEVVDSTEVTDTVVTMSVDSLVGDTISVDTIQ